MADSIENSQLIDETLDTEIEPATPSQEKSSWWSRAASAGRFFARRVNPSVLVGTTLWEHKEELAQQVTTWGGILKNEEGEREDSDLNKKSKAKEELEESVESDKDNSCYNLKLDDLEQTKQEKIVQKIEDARNTTKRLQEEQRLENRFTPGELYQSLIMNFLNVDSPEDISIDYLMQLDVRAGIEMMDSSPPRTQRNVKDACKEHSPIASYCTQQEVEEYCQKVSEIAYDSLNVDKQNFRPERSLIQKDITKNQDINTEQSQKSLSDEAQTQWMLEQNLDIDR